MRLTSDDGSLFEMSVGSYQFPDIQNEPYDSNWLLIRIHVVHPRGEWTTVDPCLLTDELEDLANWFGAIAEGKAADVEQNFTEPNLMFRLRETPEGRSLRVYFELESRPSWAESRVSPEEDLFLDFPLGELDLARAAEELRGELALYPERAMP